MVLAPVGFKISRLLNTKGILSYTLFLKNVCGIRFLCTFAPKFANVRKEKKISELFGKLIFKVFFKSIMGIKNLIVNGNLESFADDENQTMQMIKCDFAKFVFCRMFLSCYNYVVAFGE
jgi:hypothetical protein